MPCRGFIHASMVWLQLSSKMEKSLHISSVILTDHLYSMMKHFSLDGSDVLPDDTTPFIGYKGSLNGLMCRKIMQIKCYGFQSHQISTYLKSVSDTEPTC